MTIKVLHNQSLLDLSIIAFGSAEPAIQLAIDNDIAITDDLSPGQLLRINNNNISAPQVANYFQQQRLNPATAVQNNVFEVITSPGGIDYWAIELDFEVQ